MKAPIFTSSQFSKSETDNLMNHKFRLDCPYLELKSANENKPNIKGMGYIQQLENGSLEFKLFTETDPFDITLFTEQVPVGSLVPDNAYYELLAHDTNMRLWTAEKVSIGTHTLSKRAICTGKLESITYSKDHSGKKKDILILRYFGEIEVPSNQMSFTEITWESGEHTKSAHKNAKDIFEVEAASHKILLHKSKELSTIQVSVENGQIHDFIDTRIFEALQFTTGKSFYWSIVERYTSDKNTITIKSRSNKERPTQLRPPIGNNSEAFTKMFSTYLEYVMAHDTQKMHRFSAHLRAISRASSSTLEALALTVSVAVENFADCVLTNEQPLTIDETESIKNLKAYLREWEASKNLKDRILGSIGMISQPSTSQHLKRLLDYGVITHKQKSAWHKIRNKVMHGASISDIPVQELLIMLNSILVMCYRIIFFAIGYEGKYLDSSEMGYPEKDFNLNRDQKNELSSP